MTTKQESKEKGTTAGARARTARLATARADEAALRDARQVAAAVEKNFKAMAAFDKVRKEKLFSAALLTEMKGLIRIASTAITARQLTAEKSKGKTAELGAMTAELIDMVRTNRDIVAITHEDQAELGRGFGIGKRLKTAEDALAISSLQQQTVEDDALGVLAAQAGFTSATIKPLINKRRELVAVMAGKGLAAGDTRGLQNDKVTAISQLRKLTIRARATARIVFRTRPSVLIEFEGEAPKRGGRKAGTASAGTGAKATGEAPVVDGGGSVARPNGADAPRKLTVTATAAEI